MAKLADLEKKTKLSDLEKPAAKTKLSDLEGSKESPKTIVAPVAADPDDPSFWNSLMQSFSAQGVAEMEEAKAGLLSMDALIEIGTIIDKPINAVQVGLYNTLQATYGPPDASNLRKITATSPAGKLFYLGRHPKRAYGIFKNGMIEGYNHRQQRDWLDSIDLAVFGMTPEIKARGEAFMNSKPGLKQINQVAHLGTEILVDIAIDKAALDVVAKGSKVVRAGVARAEYAYRGPEFYTTKYWDDMKIPPKVARKGPSAYIEAVVKKNHLPLSVDDIMAQHFAHTEDINFTLGRNKELLLSPQGKAIRTSTTASAKYRQGLQDAIKQADNEMKSIARKINTEIDPLIAKHTQRLNDILAPTSVVPDLDLGANTVTIDYDAIHKGALRTRKYITQQTAKKTSLLERINALQGTIDDTQKALDNTFHVNYLIANKAIRESAWDNYIKSYSLKPTEELAITKRAYKDRPAKIGLITRKEVRNTQRKIIRAVTQGRFSNIEDLTNTEFLSMFDFLDYYGKHPSAYKFQTTVRTHFKGARDFAIFGRHPLAWIDNRKIRVVPPGYNWITPSWKWYERSNLKAIPQIAESADIASMQTLLEATDGWEDMLSRFGKVSKVRKDVKLQKHIFKAAKGDYEYLENIVAQGVVTADQVSDIVEAGLYYNKIADQFADAFEAEARWAAGLKRQRYYAHDIVKRAADESIDDVGMLTRLMEPYDYALGERLDIKEFINKVQHSHEILENADASFRAFTQHETYKLFWEPAIFEMNGIAQMTDNPTVINYTKDFIKYSVKGEISPVERWTEPFFSAFARGMEHGSKIIPGWNFTAQTRATRQISTMFRKATYHGAMWGRPIPAIRNMFQSLHAIPLTAYDDYAWGMQSLFTEGGQELANSHCRLLIGRMPLENFDIRSFKGFGEFGHKGFRFMDRVPNIKGTFNTSAHWLIRRDDSYVDIVRKFGKFDRFGSPNANAATISKAFHAGELPGVKETANAITKTAQYGYRSIDMSKYMSNFGPFFGRTLGQFTSWPANYYYSFLPDIAEYALTGVGPGGTALTWAERTGLLKHVTQGTAIKVAGAQMGFNMGKHLFTGALPTAAPAWNFIEGAYYTFKGSVQGDARAQAEGLRQMNRGLTFAQVGKVAGVPVPYPSPLILRQLDDIASGDKPFKSLFLPVLTQPSRKRKKKSGSSKRR